MSQVERQKDPSMNNIAPQYLWYVTSGDLLTYEQAVARNPSGSLKNGMVDKEGNAYYCPGAKEHPYNPKRILD